MDAEVSKKTFVLKGVGVSPGVVIGKAYLFDRREAQVPLYKLSDPALINAEVIHFRKALEEAEKHLLELKNKLSDMGGGMEPLYIIDVHVMILRDAKFIDQTILNIREKGVNAEWAVRMTIDKYREIFARMDDDYLRGRISDIQHAGERILAHLAGEKKPVMEFGEEVIIVASDLSPADTAQMKIDKVLAIATDVGGKTSHTAIVARSIEIPAVLDRKSVV